jgi:hypothetical protein
MLLTPTVDSAKPLYTVIYSRESVCQGETVPCTKILVPPSGWYSSLGPKGRARGVVSEIDAERGQEIGRETGHEF